MREEISWLFFDVGTTLMDETEAYRHRIHEATMGTEISYEQFIEKQIFFAKQNKRGYEETLDYFGLSKTPYHREYETPYPHAKTVLKVLKKREYHIGIIANQSEGTASRLLQWGLLDYIDLVISSAEEGVSKPDKEIFLRALNRAECAPQNAVMIGDRLDNDIFPAKQLGMRTIWIRQGFAIYHTPYNADYQADDTVTSLTQLLELL